MSMRPLLLSIRHSAVAQFALTHRERIRGGIQLNIMPISYINNTKLWGSQYDVFHCPRARGLSGATRGLSSTTKGLSDLDP